MSMFDKLMGGFGKKAETQHTDALEVMKKKLAGIVYDDELVNELAPIFAKLSTHEGFDKVVELLESKEAQLEKVAGGEWTHQETDGDSNKENKSSDEDDKSETLSAEEILAQKYSQK